MNYITKGKIYERGPITEGVSASGNRWQRMTLVLDVPIGQYSKKMAFQVMTGNIAAVMAFNDGDRVEVAWDVSSREYTNKEGVRSWFTQIELREIKAAEVASEAPVTAIQQNSNDILEDDEDLPFYK